MIIYLIDIEGLEFMAPLNIISFAERKDGNFNVEFNGTIKIISEKKYKEIKSIIRGLNILI